jgi:hypothetical protein
MPMSYQPEPYQPEFKPEPKPGASPGPQGPSPYAQQPYPGQVYYQDPRELAAIQWRQDNEHLQLLAILYYVMGGFATLGACIPLVYFGIGVAFVGGAAAASENAEASAGMAAFGGFILVIAMIVFAVIFVQALCLFLTGRFLSTASGYMFCFINACLLCMHAPIGTALGIFTIVVLSRETVKQRFEMNRYYRKQYS